MLMFHSLSGSHPSTLQFILVSELVYYILLHVSSVSKILGVHDSLNFIKMIQIREQRASGFVQFLLIVYSFCLKCLWI